MEKPKNSGRFGPGNPGKPKGAKTKITADVKEMLLVALSEAGGAEYLFMQAFDNPSAFLALVGKVLPMQVTGPGPNGAHVFENIVRTIVDPK